MKEINPHHPVTAAAHDHWHKLCGLLLYKFAGEKEVVIELADMEKMQKMFGGEMPVVMLHDTEGHLVLKLIRESEAERIANRVGGRFQQ